MVITEETLQPLRQKDGMFPVVVMMVFQEKVGKRDWKTKILGKTIPDAVYASLIEYVKNRA